MNEKLKQYLASASPWIQQSAFKIATQGVIEETDYTELIKLIQSNAPYEESLKNIYFNFTDSREIATEISSINSVSGIDALAPTKPLNFSSSNLTVVYGKNGAGKSGYTRIIKNLCGKVDAETLKSNVFTDNPSDQEVNVSYKLGDQIISKTWTPASGSLQALSNINIFDTKKGQVYLDSDTVVSYTPPELSLLEKLVQTGNQLEKILNDQITVKPSKLPKLPDKYQDTKVALKYDKLDKLKEKEIEELIAFSEEDSKRLNEVTELYTEKNHSKRIKDLQSQKEELQKVIDRIEKARTLLSSDSVENYITLKEKATRARRLSNESALALKAVSKTDAISSTTWRALWEEARKFSAESAFPNEKFPPAKGEKCVLCHQELSEEASLRMLKLEEFITSNLENDAKEAEKTIDKLIKVMPAAPEKEDISSSVKASGIEDDDLTSIHDFWSKYKQQAGYLKIFNFKDIESNFYEESKNLVHDLNRILTKKSSLIKTLSEAQKSENQNKLIIEGKELGARKWCNEQSESIIQEQKRLEEVKVIEECKKQTKTTGITRKATELAKDLLTDAYVGRFNRELQNLGASHIQIELKKGRSSKGVVRHALYLKGLNTKGKEASEILSEGENRIVSLAAFIADMTGDKSPNPFIFDDPISSLDQSYEEKTIERLVSLSQERQVIVFTHRLSFLGILQDYAGKGNINTIHIRKESCRTGQPCDSDVHTLNPKSAFKLLAEKRIAEAKRVRDNSEDSYLYMIKSICSDFRLLIERTIETYLISDIVQRHRRSIKTNGMLDRLTKVSLEDCILLEGLMGKYSKYEHSQSLESPSDLPVTEDIQADIKSVVDWITAFKKREPKS